MQELKQQLPDRFERLWLKLDLERIEFYFRIKRYQSPKRDYAYEDWCKVDLIVRAEDWLNYHLDSQEVMFPTEVMALRNMLDDLLHDRLKEPDYVSCIEPDFTFNFHLSGFMDFCIDLLTKGGSVTDGTLILHFGWSDMEKLLCYLNLVTGKINEEDEFFKKLMEEGYISE